MQCAKREWQILLTLLRAHSKPSVWLTWLTDRKTLLWGFFFFPALCSETWRSPKAPGFLPMPCTVGKFSKHAQFQAVCIWVPHHVPGIPAPFPCWVPSPLPFPLVSWQVPSPVLSSQPVEHWPTHPLPTSTFSTQHVKSSSSSHRLLPPSCYHTQTHSKITRLF